jgi:hypothetical protein
MPKLVSRRIDRYSDASAGGVFLEAVGGFCFGAVWIGEHADERAAVEDVAGRSAFADVLSIGGVQRPMFGSAKISPYSLML